jgi:hypothetical protein
MQTNPVSQVVMKQTDRMAGILLTERRGFTLQASYMRRKEGVFFSAGIGLFNSFF